MYKYFINLPENLNKEQQIVDLHEGEILEDDPIFGDWEIYREQNKALVCVIKYDTFDAAVFAVNDLGMEEEQLQRIWVAMDWDLACKLSGCSDGK